MNDISNLISEELSKMYQLFHHQRGRVISEQPAKDVTDLKTYPACVQKLPGVKITQTAAQVFAKTDSGPFLNYQFYNNGRYSGPNKTKGNYSCSGTDILIDGKKLTTTSTTYPPCITNKGWGEPTTSKGGQTSISGGKTEDGVDFTGYLFYNNNRVVTPKGVTQSYKCSADNTIISIFATPAKAPAATAPKSDETAKIKNIGYAWCREKDGIINWPGSAVDKMKWADYLTKYSVTEPQLTQAKTACPNKLKPNASSDTPNVNANNQKQQVVKKQVASINKEIQKSIGSTNPTGSLSDDELQQLLTKLGGTA